MLGSYDEDYHPDQLGPAENLVTSDQVVSDSNTQPGQAMKLNTLRKSIRKFRYAAYVAQAKRGRAPRFSATLETIEREVTSVGKIRRGATRDFNQCWPAHASGSNLTLGAFV